MSEQRHKRIRAIRVFCKTKNIPVHHETNYPQPARTARLGGRRIKGTNVRVIDRLANGMIYHLPNAHHNNAFEQRLYLLHFGEPASEVELAIAQLQLYNPTDRKEIFVILCMGERP